ncbi:DUF4157 domain-containing protein [Streptomyces inhibens]|uniref:DUF4157 domain-containing protein n=1 Tax=Streptomyces inhibens TaxID=2293571 RepID=A0A371PU51_STRIH|nr:DUF4157 domain-containing protein [Streptomyces inhibens]
MQGETHHFSPEAAPVQSPGNGPAALIALQRSAGNRAVGQLLAREPHAHDTPRGHQQPIQRSTVHDVLRSPGSPLDESVRTEREARLDADFSDVRLHTGPPARRSATELGARAYTSGSHIVIGNGGADKHTLAHELTHVIQQRTGPVSGTDNGSGLSISGPCDTFERAAEENATRVLARPVPTPSPAVPAAVPPERQALRAEASAPTVARFATAPSGSPVIQRRGENPYAEARQHEGWELTAHHIVPHTALVGALGKLSKEKRAEVLGHAIPETLTDQMLNNLKVVPPAGQDLETFKRELREKLAGPDPDTDTVAGVPLGDMRMSFFEWQGGNQFSGPNTSIRPEPSTSKDDIDFDGRYFTSLGEKFKELTDLGTAVKKENSEDETVRLLKEMLDITKNVAPAPFASAEWTEIGTLDELERLAGDQRLDRKHIRNYAFFKLRLSEIGTAKYDQLSAAPGGEYRYQGVPMPLQVKGVFGYIPLADSSAVATVTKSERDLTDVLHDLGVPVEYDKNGVDAEIELAPGKVTVDGKCFTVQGYKDKIPCKSVEGNKVKAVAKLIQKKKLSTTTGGKSLYQYCRETGMPVAGYLPKKLYDTLQEPSAAAPARR